MVKSREEKIFSYIVTYIFALFLLLPLIWMISTAFKTQLEAFTNPPILFVKPKLINFISVLQDKQFFHALQNSLVVSVSTVILTMLLAVPACYGLAHLRGRLKRNTLAWLLLTRAAPGMVYVVPYFFAYSKTGLLDTRIGLILINMIFTTPLVIWMLLPFFEDIPIDIEEAALVDGASVFRIFKSIAIPVVKPGIAATSIMAFIFSWNEFLFALIITRREAMTAPVSIVNFMAYAGTEWGKVSAGGIFILLPVLVFSFLIRNYLVAGGTAGAVKG